MSANLEVSELVGYEWVEEYLAALANEGVQVDIEQRVKIFGLLAELVAKGAAPKDREQLGRLLIPILAGTPGQQFICSSVLKRVIAELGQPYSSASVLEPDLADHHAKDSGRNWHLRRRVTSTLAICGIAILILAAAYFAVIYFSQILRTAPTGDVPEHTTAGAVLYGEDAWKAWLEEYPVEKLDLPRQSPRNRTSRWWYTEFDALKWVATGVPALAYFVLLAWIVHRLVAYLRREAVGRNLRALEWPLAEREGKFGDRMLLSEFQRLRKVARVHISVFDAEASVLASSKCAGLFAPRFRSIGIPVDVVAIVERRAQRDHLLEFQMAIIRSIRDAGVAVEVFEYDYHPGLCRSTRTGEVARLELLSARFSDGVFALFGSAVQLLEPARYRVLESALSLKSVWRAVLVTPDVDVEESNLEKRIARELGLEIFRSTPAGMRRMLAYVTSERATALPRANALPREDDGLLEDFLTERPGRWLQKVPPAKRDRARLLELMATRLGRPGMLLLAATSVYPELRWRLSLAIKGARDAQRGTTALDDELLFASKLPWMRHGWMPEWMRRFLQQALTEDERKRVQRIILDAIGIGRGRPTSRGERLAAHVPDGLQPRDQVKVDSVMLEFLAPALRSIQRMFVLPHSWALKLSRARLRQLAPVAILGFVCAVCAWLIWLAVLPINECDLLGSSIGDNQAVGPPLHHLVTTRKYHAEATIRACERAVAEHPGNGRYWYQLARALAAYDTFASHKAAEKGAALGYAAAFNALGYDYMEGQGVDRVDFVEARRLFEHAVALGNTHSYLNLGVVAGLEGNSKLQLEVLKQYVAAGGPMTDSLARLYRNGRDGELERDLKEYRRLLELGVERRSGGAAAEFAWAEENAIFRPRGEIDWRRVKQLYLWAIDWWEGDVFAARNLGNIYRHGRPGIQIDFKKSTYFYVFAAKFQDEEATMALSELIFANEAIFEPGFEPPLQRLFTCLDLPIPAGATDNFQITSEKGGVVNVQGRGTTDLDLRIFDSRGKSVCARTGSTDREMCGLNAKQVGIFKVTITNEGDRENTYRLCTNAGTALQRR